MSVHEAPGLYCWLPEYSVGHDVVDKQHQQIFTMINELHTAIPLHEEITIIKKVLEEMADYIEYHFDTEKSYLQEMPEFAGHEKLHWEFTQKTLQFATEYYRHPRKELLYDIVSFLAYWLKDHIKRIDIEQFRLYHQRQGATNQDASPPNGSMN